MGKGNIAISGDRVVDKRKSSDYGTLRGLVPVELIRRFKLFCLNNDLDNSEGLEKILSDFFENLDEPVESKSSTKSRKKSGS